MALATDYRIRKTRTLSLLGHRRPEFYIAEAYVNLFGTPKWEELGDFASEEDAINACVAHAADAAKYAAEKSCGYADIDG